MSDSPPYGIHVLILILFQIILKSALSFRNVTDALGFYGVYHREPWNQLIHFFGVPMIIWSLLVFLAHVPVPLLSRCYHPKLKVIHKLTYADVLTCFYLVFYLKIDRFGGLCFTPFLYFLHATATSFAKRSCVVRQIKKTDDIGIKSSSWMGSKRALKVAFFTQIFAWYVQIHPGHHIIEGASPAVTKSLGGALSSAPLFAFYEGLWFCGIRMDLHSQTLILVDKYTEELCASGQVAMRACTKTVSSQVK